MKKILQSKIFHSSLGFLVSAVLVVWLVRQLEWSKIEQEFRNVNLWYAIPVLSVLLFHNCLRALRWRYLLPHGGEIPFRLLFDSLQIGNFSTYILPLRAGEFIRPFLLSRESPQKISFSVTFASIIVERFLDLSFILLTFAFVLKFVPVFPDWVNSGAYLLTCLALSIFVFISLAITIPKQLQLLINFCTKPFPVKLQKFAKHISNELILGALVLKSPLNLLINLVLTILIWASNYYLMYLGLNLIQIEPSWTIAITTSVVIALAVAAPSAPGFIGVLQVAAVAAFALFGLSSEQATTYAVVLHMLHYGFFCSFGLWILYSRGLKLTQLRQRSLEQSPI